MVQALQLRPNLCPENRGQYKGNSGSSASCESCESGSLKLGYGQGNSQSGSCTSTGLVDTMSDTEAAVEEETATQFKGKGNAYGTGKARAWGRGKGKSQGKGNAYGIAGASASATASQGTSTQSALENFKAARENYFRLKSQGATGTELDTAYNQYIQSRNAFREAYRTQTFGSDSTGTD